jgi:hypothetical protein
MSTTYKPKGFRRGADDGHHPPDVPPSLRSELRPRGRPPLDPGKAAARQAAKRRAALRLVRLITKRLGIKPEVRWSNRPKGARCYAKRVIVHLGPAVVAEGEAEILHEIAHALDVTEHTPKPHGHSFERAFARVKEEWEALARKEEGEEARK